jgi:hypothetical protein
MTTAGGILKTKMSFRPAGEIFFNKQSGLCKFYKISPYGRNDIKEN